MPVAERDVQKISLMKWYGTLEDDLAARFPNARDSLTRCYS
jgi:hypothetical protein